MWPVTDALVDRLEDDPDGAPRIVSPPDGSVDYCYQVAGREGERFESGAALAAFLRERD
ncbi:hypothetical protein Natoc_0669 [Natronococcus occultus SP4]|uniref:Uncharacterized protein n=1 Tax=Natronococcus occultus SP4 TaxID=694430 RepID=L0JWP7_9EURY|nr:hypothetical protein Natoc_0669 [Natronococcus occultus SP4]